MQSDVKLFLCFYFTVNTGQQLQLGILDFCLRFTVACARLSVSVDERKKRTRSERGTTAKLKNSSQSLPTDGRQIFGELFFKFTVWSLFPTYGHQRLISRLVFWKLSCINLRLWWFCIRFSVVIEIYRGFSVLGNFRAVFRFCIDPNAPLLESSLISFARPDSTLTWQRRHKRKRRWREGWGGGGGDYSREVINRRTAIIRGNTVSNFCLGCPNQGHVLKASAVHFYPNFPLVSPSLETLLR